MTIDHNWWKSFFDADYLHLWGAAEDTVQTARQAEGIWELLALREGSRVLDAPCGYGRLSLRIAQKGATVLGVDQSQELLARAESLRGDLPGSRLKYRRHDLREPIDESGFDAAFNIFSSIGYGTEKDDLGVFTTLATALRRGGRLLLETAHRDSVAAKFSRGAKPAQRLADGTLVIEEPVFDPLSGRVSTTWYWSGPSGQGHKSASLRIYTATELIQMLESCGFRFVSAHDGCSKEPFKGSGSDLGGRLGIVAERTGQHR